jgi:predicted pyridoxine 5'-phosphate oxidase superfamily flavin-nucleotide-binding protein
MVVIPDEVQRLIEQENVIVVGSVDKNGISNVSPRSALSWNNSSIYWIEFFEHKSRKNFIEFPWVSVAVFNTAKQHGFQLKGKVHIANSMDKSQMIYKIMQAMPSSIEKFYDERLHYENVEIIEFEPKVLYSLDPRKETGRVLAIDKDDETLSILGQLD